jgi:two-component system, chemotaxis family, CheB/CheR fusion protein
MSGNHLDPTDPAKSANDHLNQQEQDGDPPGPRDECIPIVGIGASAGGLQALEAFFDAAPSECGMAFVVVTHTDPAHTSLLPELIKRKARMPVEVIGDGVAVKVDTIYLSPSDRDPLLANGVFQLKKRPQRSQMHMPVDQFLKNLAVDRGERAACVVLSGTGTDGTHGLRLIKEKGGLAMIQRPGSARHAGMPESALGTGLVDFVLDPARMPERLIAYFKHPASIQRGFQEDDAEQADPLRKILTSLAKRTRHDFSLYKTSTLVRRVERRMTVTRSRSAEEYLAFLHRTPEEARALFHDLLIGVTSFFRDPEAFDYLKQTVVPELIARTRTGAGLRVWVAGCATGEEAYSIAMILRECLDEINDPRALQIFGTDIDARAIEKARQGSYVQNIAADVGAERLQRFFIQEGDHYRLKRAIRDCVMFAEQNILRDPPFSTLDMLVCRNLLIYLKAEAQEKLIPLFHYTLNNEGILFLGTSESIGRFPELFQTSSKQHSVYLKKENLLRPQVHFPTGARALRAEEKAAPHRQAEHVSIAQAVEQLLVREHTPACVIVDQNGEIVHIHGRTGKYLEPAQGQPNVRIADMAREGLRFALMAALRRAATEEVPVHEHGIQVKTNGVYQRIGLTVKRLSHAPLTDCLLVIFEDLAETPAGSAQSAAQPTGDEGGVRIEALEQELMRLRQDYRSALEELETSNEELRSMNEEMHSSNEEMQSTNEELESSREELQSLNEELNTVNTELHSKITQLNDSFTAITGVLNSTRIALVFLDTALRVQRFTQEAARLINLIDTDVGRPFQHISTNLAYDHLAQRAREVLERLTSVEDEVRTNDGHWYRMAIMVHRTQDHIEGVVLTFINIDAQKKAQQEIETMTAREISSVRRLADAIIDTVREALLVLDTEMHVITANRRFHDTFKTTAQATEGKHIFTLGDGQWDIAALRRCLSTIAQDGEPFEDLLVEHRFAHVGFKRMLLNGRLLRENAKDQSKILLAIQDVTGPPNTREEVP